MGELSIEPLRTLICAKLNAARADSLDLETSGRTKIKLHRNNQYVSITLSKQSAVLTQSECYQFYNDDSLSITTEVSVPTMGGYIKVDYEKHCVYLRADVVKGLRDRHLHTKWMPSLATMESTLRSIHTTPVKHDAQ
jgi:hypothetical protein